ncbi:VWA containing CoxE family protein [Pseudomonas aeruginosa]|nr:VWA containing CoxE family protein [Pseudomonas aeruginosa]
MWKNNLRRSSERTATFDLLHKYGPDYKVVFVGDAAMAPYEITQAGGSVEHWNEEAGYVWMQRFMEKYKKLVWINPYPKDTWNYTASTGLVPRTGQGTDVSVDPERPGGGHALPLARLSQLPAGPATGAAARNLPTLCIPSAR